MDFLVDTGFNGEIALSDRMIHELNLEPIGFSDYMNADGMISHTQVFKGTIVWFNQEKDITVISTKADIALIGMTLLDKTDIQIARYKNILTIHKPQ